MIRKLISWALLFAPVFCFSGNVLKFDSLRVEPGGVPVGFPPPPDPGGVGSGSEPDLTYVFLQYEISLESGLVHEIELVTALKNGSTKNFVTYLILNDSVGFGIRHQSGKGFVSAVYFDLTTGYDLPVVFEGTKPGTFMDLAYYMDGLLSSEVNLPGNTTDYLGELKETLLADSFQYHNVDTCRSKASMAVLEFLEHGSLYNEYGSNANKQDYYTPSVVDMSLAMDALFVKGCITP